MKKCISLVVTVFMISILFISPNYIYAEQNEQDLPSSWAQEEIEISFANNLVPQELKSNYRQNIKRSEYVLLALKLFEKTGQAIEISDYEPFTDIKGHIHEDELVKAYSVGIIDGYDDGTFKPNNTITREEVAALVVQLLKAINPNEDIEATKHYDYVDSNEIGDWAKPFINYCYENEILQGVGDKKIAPKGNATREQSIILIYRLAKKKNIIISNRMLSLEYTDNLKELEDNDLIKNLIQNFSDEVVSVISELSKEENINLTDVNSEGAMLTIKDAGMINIVKSKYEISLYSSTSVLDNETYNSSFEKLLNVLDNSEETKQLFRESVLIFENEEQRNIRRTIGKNDVFEVQVQEIKDSNGDEIKKYIFVYHDSI